ncbi:MAG: 3-deoxy-7-phosphoheptulonate synthase [Planctomycetota bacterium]
MVIVMKPGATPDQVEHVIRQVREMGLKDHPIVGTELTVVAVIGDDRKKDRQAFESLPGVEKVVAILAPYKRASREIKPDRTEVRLGPDCVIGGPEVVVIAGPCSVESESQILAAARAVKSAGAKALRGGAFKPRTNPYVFQGLGEEGLKLLARAREETGLPIVTEILTPGEVDMVVAYADCLQIGTRNAQNFKLLEACGRQPKPVLFKRGLANTIDEYLQAAEYILDAGNPNVILCERGIRTFETHSRNTLSLSAVAEIRYRSHLPVIVDPSQGTGHAHLVPAMCNAAVAAGADGLIVEVHPDPAHALTDAAQSIAPDALVAMMPTLRKIAEAVGRAL